MKHWKYLRYVLRHKYYVLLAGLVWRVPLWSLVWHDWDKFLPDEWFPYVESFYGPKPPTDTVKVAFDFAWLLHQRRNRHHWQFWLLSEDEGGVKVLPMPDYARREMLADWIGAGRAQGKPDTRKWYLANRYNMQLHPETRTWIEQQLRILGVVAA